MQILCNCWFDRKILARHGFWIWYLFNLSRDFCGGIRKLKTFVVYKYGNRDFRCSRSWLISSSGICCLDRERLKLESTIFVSSKGSSQQDGRLASLFSAQIEVFWSTFANIQERDYCFESIYQRFPTNVSSTTDFYNLCKRGSSTTSCWQIFVSQYRKSS